MKLNERVDRITEHFEYIVGGPDEAGRLLSPWSVDLCALMFLDAAVKLEGSERFAAIVVWATVMHAYRTMGIKSKLVH